MTRSETDTMTKTRTATDAGSGDHRLVVPCKRVRDCACGQQLDMCAGAHCPRCGRSLRLG